MRAGKWMFVLAALVALLTAIPAVPQGTQAVKSKQVSIPFEQLTLKNGLRVILSADHAAPTYSICVTYDVGSRNERPGRTGFAHLFEHMMFQGSENVGKGEHFILVYNNGGGMNGTTTADRTNYFESLPANQLDLGLFLEADRMRSLAVTQANLDNQRNAVQEERRLRLDNEPYGRTFETLFETAYTNFVYKHSTMGSMADLNAATVQDLRDFFRIYYAPNNAVLVLVGDFQKDEALGKIRKYFEDIPAQPKPPQVYVTEPPQTAPRQAKLDDPFAEIPRIDIGYKAAAGALKDFFAVDMMADILTGGESSRLYQKLVKEEQVAVEVEGGTFEMRGPSLTDFIAMLRPGVNPAAVEKLILAEIERIRKEPVADWELEKIRMTDRRQHVERLYSTLSRSELLAQFAVFYNDPARINTLLDSYNSVTKADIQRVAQTYFVPNQRTVVLTLPKAQPPGPAKQAPGE